MTGPESHDLSRFVEAQAGVYETALAELTAGEKRSHWMWFIFPQLAGLGRSEMAQRYAIASLEEAKAYLSHPLLGDRLLKCNDALLGYVGYSATEILGDIDALKLRSSMTLFERACWPESSSFEQMLDAFFSGQRDERTLTLLNQ